MLKAQDIGKELVELYEKYVMAVTSYVVVKDEKEKNITYQIKRSGDYYEISYNKKRFFGTEEKAVIISSNGVAQFRGLIDITGPTYTKIVSALKNYMIKNLEEKY
ncbi:MAG: hypothetical protein QXK76_03430 [Candidatus Woesearchaeota archaeon]